MSQNNGFNDGAPFDDGRKIYSVTELNREIKTVLEDTYPEIWLEGEISNYRLYQSGHIYLTLKDAESQISAVIFQGYARFLKFKPEDGIKVTARGKVSVYTPRGDYQLIISSIEPAGKGAMQLAFEQLKSKLQKEGLFDASRKKPLPFLPSRIGIVTSPHGAAIRDILCILDRRYSNLEVLLYPARVQGEGAAGEIAAGIRYFSEHETGCEVLLVGRGGGSYEDLWAFNEEPVARAMAASRIPVISCVGHETDFTIADFVADLRAPTPSAAAELVVHNKRELSARVATLGSRLTAAVGSHMRSLEQCVKHLASSRALRSPTAMLDDRLQYADDLMSRLDRSMKTALDRQGYALSLFAEKMSILSPLNVLDRGYAVCWKEPEHRIVRDAAELSPSDLLHIRLFRGEVDARVEKAQ